MAPSDTRQLGLFVIVYADDYHCSIFKCEMLGKKVCVMSRDLIVAGQCAIVGRCGGEHNIWAKLLRCIISQCRLTTNAMRDSHIIIAALASITPETGSSRFHCDTIPYFVSLDFGTHLTREESL